MARLCVLTMPKPHADVAAKLITCYSYALMHHLQGRREDEPFLDICGGMHIPVELQSSNEPSSVTSDPSRIGQVFAPVGPVQRGGFKEETAAHPLRNLDWHQYRTCLPSSSELVERIKNANNKPLEILLHLSTLVKTSIEWKQWMMQNSGTCSSILCNTNVERDKLEGCASELMDIMGKCERIVKSPVPASWNRHTSRLISVWTLTLPFVLVPIQGFLSVPTVAVISWVLFSIEEIGHLLEDPFRLERYSLQLDVLCETIRKDVLVQIASASKS